MTSARQAAIEKKGLDIFNRMKDGFDASFPRNRLASRVLAWSLENQDLKTQLFRLVDVLPVLPSSAAIAEHARDYLKDSPDLPPLLRWSTRVAPALPWLTAAVARKSVA